MSEKLKNTSETGTLKKVLHQVVRGSLRFLGKLTRFQQDSEGNTWVISPTRFGPPSKLS